VTITKCFRKAGLVNTSEQLSEGLDEEEVEQEDKEGNIKSRNSIQKL
jgi:hypothetical protein